MIEMSGASVWRVVTQMLVLGAGLFFGSAGVQRPGAGHHHASGSRAYKARPPLLQFKRKVTLMVATNSTGSPLSSVGS